MGCVEIDLFKAAAGIEANGPHHIEGVGDFFGDHLILLSDRGIDNVAKTPVHWSV